ncbi:MAG TPA: Cof-type HAD-IIB family hydrolase [Firmicutes bacterium]|nr:Cof-type HAD-IIB family hydrolase [Bacillota bacterium]
MTKSLILFDIDGTLLQSDINQIPDSTILALTKLKAAGHDLGIATGRPLYLVDERIRNLPVNVFITANGQHILYNNDVIYENPIPSEVVQSLIDEAKALNIPIGLVSSNQSAVTVQTEGVLESFKRVSMPLPSVGTDLHHKESILQAWFFSNEFEQLQEKYETHLKFVPWLEFGADVVPLNGSKAEGIKYLMTHLDEVPKRLITFGDGYNDLEMLELADIGVAMGNAHDDVKLRADFVTKRIDEDGIYHACEILDLF